MNTIKKSEVKSPLREVRLRVAFCFGLIMLSADSINPVKVVCGILGVDTFWALCIFSLIFIAIISANAKELVYFMMKVFFHSILSIFFSSMEVLGRENIPPNGPVIFTGNHMNQFVDGAVMMVTATLPVGFLVAEKSMHKRIIGDFAKAIGSIPVSRPQDAAKPGPGKIYAKGLQIFGENTKFTALKKGDRVRPGKSPDAYRIAEVISDTEGILAEEFGESSPAHDTHLQQKWTNYDILEYVDQRGMFDAVQKALADGKCLGIFPEGGSHDRTDLLPLKAGVAAIALGVKEKYNTAVPIIPVGLNYFRGHRFRGRVVVEFGAPIYITPEIMEAYHTSKRSAYQMVLQEVEDGMRSVIVTASDYSELKLLHTARRLFQKSSLETPTKLKQEIARRLSIGFKLLKEKYGGEANLPADILACMKKIEDYQDTLDYWGLKDYQLQNNANLSASIPSLLLNAPVGAAANYWAHREAQKDLKASRVKLAARDVLLSKKIVFSLAAVPVLWVFYALLAILFTNWRISTIFVLFLSCPVFSYLGVMAVEAGMADMKDLRPALLRLMPSFQEQAVQLPKLRQALADEVRAIIHKYGPETGAVYLDQSPRWESATHNKKSSLSTESNNNAGSSAINNSSTAAASVSNSHGQNSIGDVHGSNSLGSSSSPSSAPGVNTTTASTTATDSSREESGLSGSGEAARLGFLKNQSFNDLQNAANLLDNIASFDHQDEDDHDHDEHTEHDSSVAAERAAQSEPLLGGNSDKKRE